MEFFPSEGKRIFTKNQFTMYITLKERFFFFLNTEQNGNNGVEMPSKQLKVLVLATTKYVCLLHNLYISKSLLP